MQANENNDRISTKTKLFYGIGDVGNAVLNTAINFFLLLFYTDAALIAPALAGSAMLVGKLWDAVNDPLFGWLSDRTRSRFGKRRVFMIFGAIPLGLFASLLWIVPGGMSKILTFVWIATTFILFDTFMTITSTPYYSLTAELTRDYNERASLTAYRMLFGVIAFMVGAAGTPFFVGLFPTQREGYMVVGIIYGVLCVLALWISASGFREKEEYNETVSEASPWKSFVLAIRNRAFLQLIVAYLSAQLGFTLVQTLMAYFLTYQLNMEAQVPLVMVVLLLSVIVFLFPWKKLAERWNKGPAYACGLGIAAIAILATFLLPSQPTPFIYLIAIIAGIGFSANWVLPWAMIPDVVDLDQLETGHSRSGMYYGVWGFTSKLTAALGVSLTGWVLQLSGYIPNVAQSEHTLTWIRAFFGVVPAVMFLISLPMLFLFPITFSSHTKVLQELARRNK